MQRSITESSAELTKAALNCWKQPQKAGISNELP
jgi:hypothetical protein